MPVKINYPGIKFRKISEVHKSIINRDTGKRRRDIDVASTLDRLKNNKSEVWGQPGDQVQNDLRPVLIKEARRIKSIYKSVKRPVDIMILGPGEGAEVLFLKSFLQENIKTNIDTLGLSNALSTSAKKEVRTNYSPNKPDALSTFDHFNHLHLIKKYDYIYSHLGPGYYSLYPEIALLKIGSMLRPGGIARIHVNSNISTQQLKENMQEYLYLKEFLKSLKIKVSDYNDWVIIKRIK